MDNTIINDDDMDQSYKTDWIPTEWIGCGKKYRDIPPIVDAARRTILKIPSFFTTLNSMDDDTEWFMDEPVSPNLEEPLPFLTVPSGSIVKQLLNKFGQAWFDEKKTLRTWINPEI
ncbi:hypothetical protein DFH09DRAFT_1077350 [Mycena vulgaris]|nr:hypothetical protein DFH09DRAFT_1077350 [Mycena vulgaris]